MDEIDLSNNNSSIINDKFDEEKSENFINDLFEIDTESDLLSEINIENKKQLDAINGSSYYYKVIMSSDKEASLQPYNESGESYYQSYTIDYENKYISIIDIKNSQYCKITYINNLPVKEEYFDENNKLLYIVVRNYFDNTKKVFIEKEYNNYYNIVKEKEFIKSTGKLKKEKTYDKMGNLSYIKLYGYNNYSFLIQETLLNSRLEQLEFKRYIYEKNKIFKEIFYSGDGILKSETLYGKNGNPILIKYYEKGSNILYEERFEYYNGSSSVKKKENRNDKGELIRVEKYDRNGNQKEVIISEDNIFERRVFSYTFVSDFRVIDEIKIYRNKFYKPVEVIKYFYDELSVEVNNWIKYDDNGKLISSMDMENNNNNNENYYYGWYEKW